jgi:NADPH:quinone reductase
MYIDPYLRGGLKVGEVPRPMSGFVSGIVVASKNPNWVEGDLFGASLPYTTIQVVTADQMAKTLMWKLTGYIDAEHLSYGVGVLGMPGSTAYGGLIDVLRPNAGSSQQEVSVCECPYHDHLHK